MKLWNGWIVFILFTTGCTPALPTLPPAPSETILQHTPALRYIEEGIKSCSLANSPLPVLVNEYTSGKMNFLSADISLVYEKPLDPNLPAYIIGEDRLVLIIHPQNPLRSITAESLQGVLQGFINSWIVIDPTLERGPLDTILISTYENEDDFQKIIEIRLNGGKVISQSTTKNVYPGEVVEYVSQTPGSLGVIPSAYLTDTVKELQVAGLDGQQLHLEIIAQTRKQPSGPQTILISCLQKSVRN